MYTCTYVCVTFQGVDILILGRSTGPYVNHSVSFNIDFMNWEVA